MTDATPWRRIDPPSFAKPVGYSNAVAARGGTRVAVAGQTAMDATGAILHPGDVEQQAAVAFRNVKTVLEEAGAKPGHVVRMRIFTTDVAAWRAASKPIGEAWRACFGRWYPAMTLVEVRRLYDPGAVVEVEAEAVVPDA
jgi:enamine deaminase RidA (YjgF/YER057c/UK114 family)